MLVRRCPSSRFDRRAICAREGAGSNLHGVARRREGDDRGTPPPFFCAIRSRCDIDRPPSASRQPHAISRLPSAASPCHKPPAVSRPPSVASHQPSAIGRQPPAISPLSSAARRQPPAISHLPSAASHLPSPASHRLSGPMHQPPPFAACRLAPTVPVAAPLQPTWLYQTPRESRPAVWRRRRLSRNPPSARRSARRRINAPCEVPRIGRRHPPNAPRRRINNPSAFSQNTERPFYFRGIHAALNHYL